MFRVSLELNLFEAESEEKNNFLLSHQPKID